MTLGESKRVGFGRSAALIIVDMTRSLTDPSSPFYTQQAGECLFRLQPLLQAARDAGIPRFFTKGGLRYYTAANTPLHELQRGAWLHKSEPHELIDDPALWEIAPEFAVRPDELVIEKTKPSAFFGTPLASYLAYLNVDTAVIGGMMTGGCVRCTVVDAFQYNYRVIIPQEGVADRRLKAHKYHLEEMDLKYGDVMPVESIISRLRGR